MSTRRRLTIPEAIDLAQRRGIRVRTQRDGHVLFFLDGNRTVNVNPGRKGYIVPARLALALQRGTH